MIAARHLRKGIESQNTLQYFIMKVKRVVQNENTTVRQFGGNETDQFLTHAKSLSWFEGCQDATIALVHDTNDQQNEPKIDPISW